MAPAAIRASRWTGPRGEDLDGSTLRVCPPRETRVVSGLGRVMQSQRHAPRDDKSPPPSLAPRYHWRKKTNRRSAVNMVDARTLKPAWRFSQRRTNVKSIFFFFFSVYKRDLEIDIVTSGPDYSIFIFFL